MKSKIKLRHVKNPPSFNTEGSLSGAVASLVRFFSTSLVRVSLSKESTPEDPVHVGEKSEK